MRRVFRSLMTAPVLILALVAGGCGMPGRTAGNSQSRAASTGPAAPPVATPSAPSLSLPTQPGTSPTPAPPRTLTLGMTGAAVRQLQIRLTALHYYPGAADGQFGQNTLEALWAFQTIQGLHATGEAGPATRNALANPRYPDVLVPTGGALRVEIDLSRQVLVLYQSGRVTLISHISSGGGYYYCSPDGGCRYAITPTGDFRTTAYMPGWITVPLGEMYNPVFFIGTAYAIHGSASVPSQPASHGCVRIPMIVAEVFHKLIQIRELRSTFAAKGLRVDVAGGVAAITGGQVSAECSARAQPP
jgi:peptidoglycan hydrolase-like protein with peptidoglycan-binding domain